MITPRTTKAGLLVQAIVDEHPFEPSDAETITNLKWRD